ncbi:MAG: hypothetical protein WC256_11995 [Desulfurivibrionaceae bacterium]
MKNRSWNGIENFLLKKETIPLGLGEIALQDQGQKHEAGANEVEQNKVWSREGKVLVLSVRDAVPCHLLFQIEDRQEGYDVVIVAHLDNPGKQSFLSQACLNGAVKFLVDRRDEFRRQMTFVQLRMKVFAISFLVKIVGKSSWETFFLDIGKECTVSLIFFQDEPVFVLKESGKCFPKKRGGHAEFNAPNISCLMRQREDKPESFCVAANLKALLELIFLGDYLDALSDREQIVAKHFRAVHAQKTCPVCKMEMYLREKFFFCLVVHGVELFIQLAAEFISFLRSALRRFFQQGENLRPVDVEAEQKIRLFPKSNKSCILGGFFLRYDLFEIAFLVHFFLLGQESYKDKLQDEENQRVNQ